MIFIYHGKDFEARNLQKNKMLDVLKKKRPDSVFLKVSDELFNESFLRQNIEAAGLFDEKNIFEISGVFLKKENEKLVQEYIEAMESSDNAFIFSEESISVKTKNLLEKHKIKNYEFEQKVKGGADLNIFSITDLFLKKDKKNIWLKYSEFLGGGVSEEEIFGVLFWSIKTLNIINSSNDISETNLKPFVYNKNKKYLSSWKDGEAEKKMSEMINIYHNSRRGICDFKIELEKLILS